MNDIHAENLTPSIPDTELVLEAKRDTSSLDEIYERIRCRWGLVLVSTLVTFAIAVGYLEFATPLYTAEIAVAPPMQNYSDRVSGTLSGLGALAGLALGSGSGGPSTPFLRYEKMLTSREVATRLVRDHNVLQLVFSRRWDAVHQRWKPPHTIAQRLEVATNYVFGRRTDMTPDAAELRRFITKHLSIEVPSADMALEAPPAIRYVTFTFRDSRLAAQILVWLHQETDGVIRENELNRTRHMIAYLDDKLQKTTEVDERASLTQLLLDQERTEMLLTTGLDFSAEVIDPPGIPREPSYPQIPLTLILGIVTGLLLGSLIAISRNVTPKAANRMAGESRPAH